LGARLSARAPRNFARDFDGSSTPRLIGAWLSGLG
jgi:hypothetical protein